MYARINARHVWLLLVVPFALTAVAACSCLVPGSVIMVVCVALAALGFGIGCSQSVRRAAYDGDCDGDGVLDEEDNCPEDANADQGDGDGDGVGDVCDNCPDESNPFQEDDDLDGEGDLCDDFPDYDADGVVDGEDNCPYVYNPAQENRDEEEDLLFGEVLGDACDLCSILTPCGPSCCVDADGDGIYGGVDWPGFDDDNDNCPYVANPGQEDRDGDGVGDVCDNCPTVANPGQEDADRDRIGDACPEDIPDFCASAVQVSRDRRVLIEAFVARGVMRTETMEVLLG